MKNLVQLIGHAGRDLESVTFSNGTKAVKFPLATNSFYKNANGEKIETTQWHNIVAYGKLADILEIFVKKGSHVGIQGKLSHRQYEDKNGIKRYYTEIIAFDFLNMTPKPVAA